MKNEKNRQKKKRKRDRKKMKNEHLSGEIVNKSLNFL